MIFYFFTGARLFLVDSEGGRTEGKLFSVGSGSLYAYGVFFIIVVHLFISY
jgi:hypothetical protein